jgi:hypothetical protein
VNIDDFKNDPLEIKKIYGNCIDRINQAYSKALCEYETIDEIKFGNLKLKSGNAEAVIEV